MKRSPEGSVYDPELYRLIIERVRDYAIFALDATGHIRTWNPAAEAMKGYTADEIIGRHFSIFYPEEDLAWDKPGFELKEAARVGRFEDEGWRLRKDGSRFWANVVITAL
jgi:PAS domain S-box-containing protein